MSRSTAALPRQEERTFPFALDPTIKVVRSETYEDPDDHDGGPPERKPLAVFLSKDLRKKVMDVMGLEGDHFVQVGRTDVRTRGACPCFAHSSACNTCDLEPDDKLDD